MMNVGLYIKELRVKKQLTQEQLGDLIGVQRAAVQKWESGKTQNLKRTTILKLSEIFDVSASSFIDSDDSFNDVSNLSFPQFKSIPLLGTISCGVPILAEQNIEKMVDCEIRVFADFALECKGDSMINARINDGDIVFIREQQLVNNGEIAAVLIDNEATLKRVYINDNSITLVAENPKYAPMIFSNEQLNNISIIGKAVAFSSKL